MKYALIKKKKERRRKKKAKRKNRRLELVGVMIKRSILFSQLEIWPSS